MDAPNDQASMGLNLFNRNSVLGLLPDETGPTMYEKYEWLYWLRSRGYLEEYVRSTFHPTDNSALMTNDNEGRKFPTDLPLDSSYYWFPH